jgi:flagellar basal-body rod protein FlgB
MVDNVLMAITTGQIDLLNRLLDVASLRQDVIAQNVANLNTPGFRSLEVSFEDALKQSLAQTSSGPATHPAPEVKEGAGGHERVDGNNVDVDQEMARLQKNALYFNIYTQLLAGNLAQFRAAIAGR